VPIQRIAHEAGNFFAPGEIQPRGQMMKSEKPKTKSWLYADEYLTKFVDYSAMALCRSCFEIYGPWRYKEEIGERSNLVLWQFCDGNCPARTKKPGLTLEDKPEKKWPRFDFNTIVELCYCCGQEVLSSGSRWSVWFCEECKERVINFNGRYQQTIIPIGRHSLMAGYALGGRDVLDPEKIELFVSSMKGVFSRIETLNHWRKIVVAEKLEALGYSGDVPLNDYLKDVKTKIDKSNAFDRLVDFFLRTAKETGKN
jgi:hypothetical protein